jgi:hypothetical protein
MNMYKVATNSNSTENMNLITEESGKEEYNYSELEDGSNLLFHANELSTSN